MKNYISLFTIVVLATVLLGAEIKRHTELEKEILGDWIAAENYLSAPQPELQQTIRCISFKSDNIVDWEYVKDGKTNKGNGRYGIYSFPDDLKKVRQLPSLTVAPEEYKDPLLCSNRLLYLIDIELDFDSRFPQSYGKLLKATYAGKKILFIRKQDKLPTK